MGFADPRGQTFSKTLDSPLQEQSTFGSKGVPKKTRVALRHIFLAFLWAYARIQIHRDACSREHAATGRRYQPRLARTVAYVIRYPVHIQRPIERWLHMAQNTMGGNPVKSGRVAAYVIEA
jgi:hypothetical protein